LITPVNIDGLQKFDLPWTENVLESNWITVNQYRGIALATRMSHAQFGQEEFHQLVISGPGRQIAGAGAWLIGNR
jgi:hypothetical protein